MTVQPQRDFVAYGFDHRFIPPALGIFLLLCLVGYAIARRMSLAIARPLAQVGLESERIGRLDLMNPVRVETGIAEIARVVQAQEEMRVLLFDATRRLEEKVAQRTAELAEREAYSRAVVDNAGTGIVSCDAEGRLLHVNEAFRRWMKLDPAHEDISFQSLLDAQDAEAFTTGLHQLERGEIPVFHDLLRFGAEADGLRWAETTVSLIKGPDGAFREAIVLTSDITDLQHARQVQEDQLRLLQSLLDVMPGAVYYKDREGRYLGCNNLFEQIFGTSRQELIGRQVEELDLVKLPEDLRDTFRTNTRRVIAESGQFEIEVTLPIKDGTSRDMFYAISGFRDKQGEPAGLVGVLVDISRIKEAERAARRAEEELRSSRQLLEGVVEHNRALIYVKDMAGVYRLINRRWEEVVGLSRDEVLGKSDSDLMPKHVAEPMQANDARVLESGEPLEIEETGPDGRIYLSVKFPLRDGLGKLSGICGLSSDITERKRLEKILAESEARLRKMLEDSPAGVGMTTERGETIFCNRKLAELLGLPASEVMRRPITDFTVNPEQLEIVRELLAEKGEFRDREAEFRRADGSSLWVLLSCRVVELEQGPCALSWYYDITERRASESAMREAKELAEEATRIKSDFLANMSHEIRTPMNAIIGMSHLALKTELTPRQRDYVTKIQQSGRHLLGIINDILDFSKIEAGKLTIERIEFELRECAWQRLEPGRRDRAAAKGLELVFDVDAAAPESLIGDPLRLGQMLINYANNAVKFTERGEISIVVRVLEQTSKEVLLHFAVERHRHRPHAGAAGRLVPVLPAGRHLDHAPLRRHRPGPGDLQASGRADGRRRSACESTAGKGSTFWFTRALRQGRRSARGCSMPTAGARRAHVLIVDDNADARAGARRVAELRWGSRSGRLRPAQRRCSRLSRPIGAANAYEIVFLDWQMPGLGRHRDGRADQRNSTLRHRRSLVLVTAYGREDVLQAAQAAASRKSCSSRSTPRLLFDAVMRVLGNEAPDDESRRPERDSAAQLAGLAGIRGRAHPARRGQRTQPGGRRRAAGRCGLRGRHRGRTVSRRLRGSRTMPTTSC